LVDKAERRSSEDPPAIVVARAFLRSMIIVAVLRRAKWKIHIRPPRRDRKRITRKTDPSLIVLLLRFRLPSTASLEKFRSVRDSEPANIASVPLRSFGKLLIRRNGSWVKSQLSDRGTTWIHIRLQWDIRVGYNVYELYCPLESIGQFGPSADPAIVATRTTT